jgi:hypothetical protein
VDHLVHASRRLRLSAILAGAAVIAGSLLTAMPAAAEEPPAPDPVVSSEPSADPTSDATTDDPAAPASDPAPEGTPTDEPAPETSPAEAGGDTVSYTGSVQRIADEGQGSDGPVMFGVDGLGYLSVDISGLDARQNFASPVTLTLRVPAGVTLSGSEDARFTKLADASTVSPLVAVAVSGSGGRQVAPRSTASLVNQTPNVSATHHVYVVYVSPKERKTKNDFQKNNTAAQNLVAAADTYWKAQSNNTIGFQLDGVVKWYQSSYGCKTQSSSLWNEAMKKAKSAGFVPGKNMHLVLLMPSGAPSYGYCGGAIGLGTIGNSVNQGGVTWVMGGTGNIAAATIKHELGHNLSLGHADILSCDSASAPVGKAVTDENTGKINGCTVRSYGDLADVMGYGAEESAGGALSSPQAIRAGIWPSGSWEDAGAGTTAATPAYAPSSCRMPTA